MQTLRIKITIETSDEETVKVKREVKISSPATQNEVDAEITKIYEEYGEDATVNWNEAQLKMED